MAVNCHEGGRKREPYDFQRGNGAKRLIELARVVFLVAGFFFFDDTRNYKSCRVNLFSPVPAPTFTQLSSFH